MTFQLLRFYLDRNQSHGQNDRFLCIFLLQLKLCRPREDLKFWQFVYNYQETAIVLYHVVKKVKIIILDKIDDELIKNQKDYEHETIKIYKHSLGIREQLIFIHLSNDLGEGNVLAYFLIDDKRSIEFLQWRAGIEIKQWLESCLEILEDGNWFKLDLKDYICNIKKLTK